MNISLIILCILVLTYFATDNVKGRKILVIVSCILFIVQSGFRHFSVGPDTQSYYFSFWDIYKTSWKEVISALFVSGDELRDPGFGVLVKTLSIVPSWIFFLTASATFFYVGLSRVWLRYIETKKGVLFAAVLWLALFNMIALSGMRQMWATGIMFFMVPYMEQKNWKVVLPCIFLGSLIHISMLFCLAFFLLSFIKEEHYNKLLVVAIALVPLVGSMSQSIMTFMVSQLENDYYKTYTEVAEGAKAYTYVIVCTSLSVFILVYNKYLKEGPWFLMSAAVMMTVLVPLILRGGTAIRIGQYFTLFMMVSLPYILDRLPRNGKMFYNVMLGVLIYYIILTSSDNYLFFWDCLPDYQLGI